MNSETFPTNPDSTGSVPGLNSDLIGYTAPGTEWSPTTDEVDVRGSFLSHIAVNAAFSSEMPTTLAPEGVSIKRRHIIHRNPIQ